MARKKGRSKSVTKAQRTLTYVIPEGTASYLYLDIMRDLSIVNRKLFRQGHVVGIESIEFAFLAPGDPASPATLVDTVALTAFTAGDTWPVHNAFVKGKALWHQMQDLVLDDNPSVRGKWADYKIYLDGGHTTATNMRTVDGGAVEYDLGEWDYSKYVLPQHEVDPVTGAPDPADVTTAHLIGPDLGVLGAWTSVGLVNAYQESRATVEIAPNVPTGFSSGFFNLLTDSGSQEPELADVVEDENDYPPYYIERYPGADLNGVNPPVAEFATATIGSPIGMMTPFLAQCGLIKLIPRAFYQGAAAPLPEMTVKVTVMPGAYKGIAAIPMGQ
uniref:Uncharacterized protein n=1 Tax=uncultured marine virus TaxID=186617 RepID=S4TFA1_9VIRU|nr:hypothetical protein [uncultured marine virus]